MKNTVEISKVRETLLSEALYQFRLLEEDPFKDGALRSEAIRHLSSLIWVLRTSTGTDNADGIEGQMRDLLSRCWSVGIDK